MEKYKLLDLFNGIGGFSLGLERSGAFETVAFCEIEPFCRRVLAKHWPDVPCYDDIRTLTAERLCADGVSVDAICGGFPCQDISVAGKGAGIEGERSGLWSEYARLIGELRPKYVIVENVAALLGNGMGRVLGDLVTLGYDAEWHCIQAANVGSPHRRDRVWVLAYAGEELRESQKNGILDGEIFYKAKWTEVAVKAGRCDWWPPEPDVPRVANGVSFALDRRGALGNAVVPQIPELIGRAIAAAEMRSA